MAGYKSKKKATEDKLKSDVIAIAGKWPKVEIGSHLTVTKYEDGTTILKWDDEALQRDVEAAIASVSTK